MNAGQSVSFLGGQAVQHFQGGQMTVAPYPVADNNHQKNRSNDADPAKQFFQAGQHGLGIDLVVELHEGRIGNRLCEVVQITAQQCPVVQLEVFHPAVQYGAAQRGGNAGTDEAEHAQ